MRGLGFGVYPSLSVGTSLMDPIMYATFTRSGLFLNGTVTQMSPSLSTAAQGRTMELDCRAQGA